MEKFVIQGGEAIRGRVRPNGNKNEALPCLAATLLTDEPVVLNNVPRIKDVAVMLEIIEELGGTYEWEGEHRVRVRTEDVEETTLDRDLCTRIRSSILFAGSMLARSGGCTLPPPGGDVIGRRRVDTHFLALRELGASVDVHDGGYTFEADELVGKNIFMDEASVTATENALMAAAVAKGNTRLQNAACEPHVQGLCRMLEGMGARIEGIGTNILEVEGTKGLWGCEHTIGPDYLEIGSFAGLSAITPGDLVIEEVVPEDLRMIRLVFEKIGIETTLEGDELRVPGDQHLEIQDDLHGEIPTIDDAPWPAFPTDMMSIAITVATQSEGTVLFFEKMFEGRMFFVDSLISMGARIVFCDPHRVVVVGPSQLYGSTLESPDIRAGMALLIAALAADGESTIYNVGQIDRGYERIDEKLRDLGAEIERLPAVDEPEAAAQ